MKPKDNLRARYSGPLRMHWQWNVILACTLIILDIYLLLTHRRSGLAALAFTAAYFLLVLAVYFHYRPKIMRELISFATSYGQVQK